MKKNAQMLSAMNKNAILNLLKEKGPCSRADIARELSLSFPAVSSNTKILMEEGLVIEAGEGDNALGRKATLLDFNARHAYVVGVDIGRYRVRAMCADLAGNILAYHWMDSKEENIVPVVFEAIREVVQQSGVGIGAISAIGVGVPGLYDEGAKRLILAPYAERWEEPYLFDKIRVQYPSAKVVFENSVNLGGIGEQWQGRAQNFHSVVYIEYGVGIGSAVIVDGKILRGANGAAGELGYMTLEQGILRREFRDIGSLEELFPSQAVGQYIVGGDFRVFDRKALPPGLRGVPLEEYAGNLPNYFAMSIINAVSMIDPELVVISGRVGVALFQRFEKETRDLLNAHCPFVPEIACTSLGEKASVIGAISIAAREVSPSYGGYEFIKPRKYFL